METFLLLTKISSQEAVSVQVLFLSLQPSIELLVSWVHNWKVTFWNRSVNWVNYWNWGVDKTKILLFLLFSLLLLLNLLLFLLLDLLFLLFLLLNLLLLLFLLLLFIVGDEVRWVSRNVAWDVVVTDIWGGVVRVVWRVVIVEWVDKVVNTVVRVRWVGQVVYGGWVMVWWITMMTSQVVNTMINPIGIISLEQKLSSVESISIMKIEIVIIHVREGWETVNHHLELVCSGWQAVSNIHVMSFM